MCRRLCEEVDARFCVVDGAASLVKERMQCRPTFVYLSKARKHFSGSSAYSTVRVEAILPQYRFRDGDVGIVPAQGQYPVWYFFYGALADSEIFSHILGLLETVLYCGQRV